MVSYAHAIPSVYCGCAMAGWCIILSILSRDQMLINFSVQNAASYGLQESDPHACLYAKGLQVTFYVFYYLSVCACSNCMPSLDVFLPVTIRVAVTPQVNVYRVQLH